MPEADSQLVCPHCNTSAGSAVIYSRPKHKSIKRLRQCNNCLNRFDTWELVGEFNPQEIERMLGRTALKLNEAISELDLLKVELHRMRS